MKSLPKQSKYKSVDGRTYWKEEDPYTPEKSKKLLEKDRHRENAVTISKIVFLERKFVKSAFHGTVSQDKRTRIVNEYKMTYDPVITSYTADPDHAWKILRKKYPLQTVDYKNFFAAYYAYRYGSVPASSLKWYTKEEIEKLDREPDPRRIRIHD